MLRRFVLTLAVVTPPAGENPPDKFNEVNVAVPELTLFVERFPVLQIFIEVIVLVTIDEVKMEANESIPPSLIIVYQLLPFARNPIAPKLRLITGMPPGPRIAPTIVKPSPFVEIKIGLACALPVASAT